MIRRFHRGGLVTTTRRTLKNTLGPLVRGLDTLVRNHRAMALLTFVSLLLFPLSTKLGAGVLAMGMAQEFLGSDRYRELYTWGLLDLNGGLKAQLGTSGLFAKAMLTLSEQFSIAGVGNGADTTDDTAFSNVISANALATNGDALEIEAELLAAANGNNKTAKIILGATTLLTTGVLTSNAKNIQLRLRIVRTAAATQNWFATVIVDGVAAVLTKGTAAENLATGLTLKLTLASPTTGAANDLLAFRYSVKASTVIVP